MGAAYVDFAVDHDVGIWHETYLVPRGSFEAIYVNMPRFGLGKSSALVPARGTRSRAAGRLEQPSADQRGPAPASTTA